MESANTVGYKTTNISAGKWYMVSAQFKDVTKAADKINLQDFIKGTFSGTTDNTTAPQIQIWDTAQNNGSGGYDIYYFYSQSSGSAASAYKNYWGKTRTKSMYDTYTNVWFDVGQSVWFKCYEDCTITTSGSVAEVNEKTVDVVGGRVWNMVANPFPVALNINSNVNWVAAGLVGTTDNTTAPEIQVWDITQNNGNGGYDIYYFYSQSSGSAATAYKNYWGATRTKAQWEIYQQIAVPVGTGFWLRYTGDPMTLTFTK